MKIRVYGIKEQGGKIIKQVEDIDNSLEGMQQFVGGYIEIIYLNKGENNLVIICDEDARSKKKPIIANYVIKARNIKNIAYIRGNHFVCKVQPGADEEFVGLTDEDIKIVKRYKEGFI